MTRSEHPLSSHQQRENHTRKIDIFAKHWVKFSDIPVHGDTLSGKQPNDCRLFFENVDGLGVQLHKNTLSDKNLTYYNKLLQRLEVDICGGAESRCHWDMLPSSHSLSKLLELRDGSRFCTGHNTHERFSIKQQGGTFLTTTPQLGEAVMEIGCDDTGLGRWCWMRFAGRQTTTRVVVAYQPCRTRKMAHNSTYAQQMRYWRTKQNYVNPRRLFREQLIANLVKWREEGDKLILMIDSNENMQSGPLSKALKMDSLQMCDVVQSQTNIPGPPTFIRGTRQIDAIWATQDLTITKACFLPFNFALGDHRGILLDISHTSFLGDTMRTISRHTGRRLQCNLPRIKEKYNYHLEVFCRRHNILTKIHNIMTTIPNRVKLKTILEKIDITLGQGMRMAEKRCRKIFAGEVPFSPDVANAGLKIKLWQLIIRYRRGRNINSKYIRRIAKKCKVKGALRCSLTEAKKRRSIAWKKYNKLKKQARRLRDEFLRRKVDDALTTKEKKQISAMIKHEDTRRSWRAINKARGKATQKGVSMVEVTNNGTTTQVTAQPAVEDAIMENNSKRFRLTESTPLMQPYMSNKLGYLADTPFAESVLNGTFNKDPHLDDYTNTFLAMIGDRTNMPQIPISVTCTDFQDYWKGCREKTSSSMSGRHFGHYKAASFSNYLSEIHASMGHITLHSGTYLSRWTKGLSVMLEKIEGVIRVDKLRAILLMEADFNFYNKLIFGHRMILKLELHNRFPLELYGSRGNMSADKIAVNRRLVIDGALIC